MSNFLISADNRANQKFALREEIAPSINAFLVHFKLKSRSSLKSRAHFKL